MFQSEKRTFILYITIITAALIIAKFIFSDGVSIISGAFKPFFLACILIYLIQPFTKFIDVKTPLNRVQSVLLAYLIFISVVVGLIIMIVPGIVSSIQSLISTATSFDEQEFIAFIQSLPFLSNYVDTSNLANLLTSLEDLIVNYISNILHYSNNVINSVGSVIYGIVILLLAFLMSFYALKDSDHIFEKTENIMRAFFSKKTCDSIVRISLLVDNAFKKYLIGKTYTCIILGAMITVTMFVLGALSPLTMPYALLVGFIVGATNFIPYIGGTLGALPSVLIVILSSGFWEGMIVWGIITITQQIDNMIVSPKILGDSVGLKPFWILAGITVGGNLFGVVGMILSVPIMSVILQLIDERVESLKSKPI